MVKVWCVPIGVLDDKRLLGEHYELHVIFNAVVRLRKGIKAGWQNHPQTKRFVNHLGMLVDRHRQQVSEMRKRGFKHRSPLPAVNCDVEPYVYTEGEGEADLELLRSRRKG